MLSDINMWNKCGRIIANLAKGEKVDLLTAIDRFYRSDLNKQLHNPNLDVYLMGDRYFEIVIREIEK